MITGRLKLYAVVWDYRYSEDKSSGMEFMKLIPGIIAMDVFSPKEGNRFFKEH